MVARSAHSADCTAVLGQGSRRRTRFTHFVRCAQTVATSQSTKRAARADPCPAILVAPQIAPGGHRLPRRFFSWVKQNRCTSKGGPGQATARLDPWSAISCASSEFPAWIAQARAAGIERALEVHDFGAGPPLSLDGRISAYHGGQRDPLGFLARHLRAPPVNLLCGEFATGHRQARGVRWWRRAAVLAAAILVTAFIQRGIEVGQLARSVERVDAAMSASLEETFPDLGAAERTRAPSSVMRDRLERLRGGNEAGGLLRLLGQVAPILGRTTRTQVRGLEFRNGILELGLRSPDVATLDSMREQFAAIPGLSAEVTASVPAETGVDGRIRIRGEGP